MQREGVVLRAGLSASLLVGEGWDVLGHRAVGTRAQRNQTRLFVLLLV